MAVGRYIVTKLSHNSVSREAEPRDGNVAFLVGGDGGWGTLPLARVHRCSHAAGVGLALLALCATPAIEMESKSEK